MNGSSFGNAFFSKTRVYVLIVLVAITFAVYGGVLFSLQIVKGYEYQNRATQVSRRIIPIAATRGEIYDRNADVPVVLNIDSFAIDLIPAELPASGREDLYARLGEILKMDPGKIGSLITSRNAHLYQPIEVKDAVSRETVYRIAERIDEFPGVTWHSKPIRNYVESGSISHVLGFVGKITTEELQILYNKGYKPGDTLGKSGVEKQYDTILRGEEGARFRTVDARGQRIDDGGLEIIEPVIGKDIVLTIDRDIQKLAEKALGPRIGTVVVMKPNTGEILALVNYPWYDPNIFYAEEADRLYRELALDPRFPFLNRAIQSAYAPASTFKILLTTAAYEEEVFDPLETITCTGEITVGDTTFRCHKKTGHGPLNLAQALAESCNVYFYTMGHKYLGIERLVDYSYRFGLGEKSGIDLPGEISGLVPGPNWKEATHRVKWVGGDTVNMSIGQGYNLVTPIQMANLVAMVANGGVIYQPHILKEIRDPITGEVLEEFEPKVLKQASIRKETFEKVQRAMRGVITEGTAAVVVTTDVVEIAGKTGTGDIGFEESWTSWFVAYAPYNGNPEEQVVVVVMVEAVNEWDWWAPKAANAIFHGIFADLDYEEVVEDLNIWYLNY